ncbi:MAG: redoxin domain-containing protein [Chloroflexota bacterium]|nr:redoxin domain-containing protein [Chloroflexota bacterium]
MVREAERSATTSKAGMSLAEQFSRHPETDEPPDFLGGPYNLSVWKPKDAEHRHFQQNAPKAGEQMPDFTLPVLDGGELTLSSLRGKPVMIEFGSVT